MLHGAAAGLHEHHALVVVIVVQRQQDVGAGLGVPAGTAWQGWRWGALGLVLAAGGKGAG